jgi:hypothetical protein
MIGQGCAAHEARIHRRLPHTRRACRAALERAVSGNREASGHTPRRAHDRPFFRRRHAERSTPCGGSFVWPPGAARPRGARHTAEGRSRGRPAASKCATPASHAAHHRRHLPGHATAVSRVPRPADPVRIDVDDLRSRAIVRRCARARCSAPPPRAAPRARDRAPFWIVDQFS